MCPHHPRRQHAISVSFRQSHTPCAYFPHRVPCGKDKKLADHPSVLDLQGTVSLQTKRKLLIELRGQGLKHVRENIHTQSDYLSIMFDFCIALFKLHFEQTIKANQLDNAYQK